MKFKKHITYKPKKQIWRILISDDENVIIEKRDTKDKQVYFDCFDLGNTKNIFKDLQLEEKFWIGIEKIYKGVILFHKFVKPDMPGHKEIIAYEIDSQKILWQNEEFAYLFLFDGKVYVYKELFEGRKFVALDFKTGEQVEDLGSDAKVINEIYDKARAEEDYSKYIFPQTTPPQNQKIKERLKELKSKLDIVDDVEYNVFSGTLLASYHTRVFKGSMINKFSAIDLESGKEIINETLAPNVESLMTDSFFVFKNYLFLLKEKTEIMTYKIE